MLEDYRLSIIFVVIIVWYSFFNNRSISCSCPLCPFCILKNLITCILEAATTCVTYVARRIWYFRGDGMAIVIGLVMSWVIFLPLSFVDFVGPVFRLGIIQNVVIFILNYIADFLTKAPALLSLMISNISGAVKVHIFILHG